MARAALVNIVPGRRVGAAAQGRRLHYVKVGNAVLLGAADVAFPAGISEFRE